MKRFTDYLIEAAEKHHVLAFGRMNPITSGHEAVVNKVHEIAKKHKAEHTVVVSHSQDAKKNPLTGEQKVKHASRAFPGTKVKSASKEHPTILHHAAELHKSGVQHLHVVAGSDRHHEMHTLLHKYNNGESHKHGSYHFKSITVHSSGARDPDAEGTTGMSASKMREHAAKGEKDKFHAGAPSKMSTKHKDEMYHEVRKGMGHHD
jgi:phosphopantetheine adenylyltransferase